jgi:hypothetical protein
LVVTENFSESMAVFDDDWRLAGWTKQVRRATIFATHGEALEAIKGLSLYGAEASVRSGRLLWEHDEDLGEIVFADPNGGPVVPQPRADAPEPGPSWSRSEIAHFARQQFREAQGKGNRPSHIGPRDVAGREYLLPVGVLPTKPIARRAALSAMAGSLRAA